MKPTLKQVLATVTQIQYLLQLQQAGFKFQKTESLINLQVKIQVSRQGVFSHLLSLNSVVYFKNTC
jgi:hypothetical protein